MALMKILRGNESNLASQELHDGYIWWLKDSHCMYIDHCDENNTLVRSKISAEYADKLRYTQDGETIELNPEDIVTKTEIEARLTEAITEAQTSLDTHIDDKSNPHEVSGSQLTGIVPISLGGTGNDTGYITAGNQPGYEVGECATAEGYLVIATGYSSHAEGYLTTASGSYSHAEGYNTKSTNAYTHAEGNNTTASGVDSHAEGNNTTASGVDSHAEGRSTGALGDNSHAEGYGTQASGRSQHTHGEYNVVEEVTNQGQRSTYVTVVGNGSYGANSNAYALDWNGNAYYKGDVYVQGTNLDASGGKKLATEDFVANAVSDKVPTSRTVNGKTLSSNITLSASDIGAASSSHNHDDKYYTEAEVDTKVNNHNAKDDAHNDIRLLITALTTKLNNFLDVDDETTDQLSEVITLINNNKGTLESLTTTKVNVADIVNNLTTNVTNKPLSAAQGVALKGLIDTLQEELDSHTSNTTIHITANERTNWNAAEKNQNAFSNITAGSTTVSADTTTDTITFVGSNVTITPDTTNDTITFTVAEGSTSAKGIVQLTNSIASTSTTTAATPSSVKSAYDLASTANDAAVAAQNAVDSKLSTSGFNTTIANYYTKEQIDGMELITIADIDTICGSTITAVTSTTGVF